MKVYYAHHMWKYGTEVEAYEIVIIRKHLPGAEIINPNGAIVQSKSEEKIMQECLEAVESCDGLVFSTISGVVGKGVVAEVTRAQQKNIPIWEIKNTELVIADDVTFAKTNSGSNRTYAIVTRRDYDEMNHLLNICNINGPDRKGEQNER